MNIAVITLSTSNVNNYAKYTKILNESYCDKHSYKFINYCDSLDKGRPPAWSKIIAIKNHLFEYDWILWIDADAFIFNSDKKLEQLIDPNFNLIICRDYNSINTGVFLLRGKCSWSLNLLNLIYSKENRIEHPWWEQQALIDVLSENKEFNDLVKIIPQKDLNGYDVKIHKNQDKNPFILHYPGISNNIRHVRIKYFYNKIKKINQCWILENIKFRYFSLFQGGDNR